MFQNWLKLYLVLATELSNGLEGKKGSLRAAEKPREAISEGPASIAVEGPGMKGS